MEKKGIHFFRLCRWKGKESWKLGLLCGWENLRASYLIGVFLDFS
jgi:hypothetical protein